MPGDLETAALDLVGLLYDGVSDTNAWVAFLRRLRDVLAARSATLLAPGHPPDKAQIALYSDPDPDLIERYNTQFAGRNVLIEEGTRSGALAPGRLVCSYEVIPRDRWRQTEIYNEYFLPLGIAWSYGLSIDLGRGALATLSLDFAEGARFLGRPERDLLQRLLPHLQRAFRLSFEVHGVASRGDALTEIVDRLACGFILLDEDARLVAANRAARAVLDGRGGLSVDRGGALTCGRGADRDRLTALIGAALKTSRGRGTAAGGALRLSRPDQEPVTVLVTPLATTRETLWGRVPRVGVIVNDAGQPCDVRPQLLDDLYGLTCAESRIVGGLLSGRNVAELARQYRVSPNTVRFHLKHALAKTETRSQAELVRRVLIETRASRSRPA